MSQNLDILLNSLENEAGANYEMSNFEMEENFEIENFLMRSRGIQRPSARVMAAKVAASPTARRAVLDEMSQNGGIGVIRGNAAPSSKVAVSDGKASAGLFNIVIKRVSSNISEDLPVPMFGYTDLASAYLDVLNAELPAGVTLIGVQMGTKSVGLTGIQPTTALFNLDASYNKTQLEGSLEAAALYALDSTVNKTTDTINTAKSAYFYYSDGTNVDSIEISCNEVAYPYFIEAMGTNEFNLSKMRLSISDTTKLSQYSNRVKIAENSMFGSEKSQSFTPTQFNDPKNFKDGIIDVKGSFEFNKAKSMIVKLIPETGFELTISCFVQMYYKQ